MATTFVNLRTLFRNYVDDDNTERFTDVEANRFINLGQLFVQQLIVDADEWYFAACQTYTVTATTDSFEFTLPTDFLKVILCERERSGDRPIPAIWVDFRLRHIEPSTGGIYIDETLTTEPVVYLRGTKLGVVAPSAGYTLRMW